jgi:riboflavin synthase
MFTGIVQSIGSIQRLDFAASGDRRARVGVGELDLSRCAIGDSIAVAGICLTVIGFDARTFENQYFEAELSPETLQLTTAGSWRVGDRVNLEAALRMGDALGGHLLSGHVDGVAELLASAPDAGSMRLRWRAPADLARFIARKGSVCLDGVSLTVNAVQNDQFDVNIIPHTQAVSTLGTLTPGARANIEIDLMARYAERLLNWKSTYAAQ